MHFAGNSWYKCFTSSCTCSLYDSKLLAMHVGMRIIVVDQQFSLVPNVCSSSTLNKLLEVWISTSLFFHWIKFCFFQFSYTKCVLCGLCYCCIVGGCCTNAFVVTHRQLLINVGMQVWFYCVWLVRIWVGLQWARSLNISKTPQSICCFFFFFVAIFFILFLCVLILNNQDHQSITYEMKWAPCFLHFHLLDCHTIPREVPCLANTLIICCLGLSPNFACLSS
jgi:hypothetical protein